MNKLAKASKLGEEINSLDNPALAQLARGDDDIDYDLDDDIDDTLLCHLVHLLPQYEACIQ